MLGVPGEGILPRVIKTYIDIAVSKRTADLGVSPSCCILLRTIYFEEGSSLQELSRFMYVDKSLITRNVKQLLEAELIENRNPLKNKYSLYLTENGREAAVKIIKIVDEIWKEMLDGFTEEEELNLKSYFARISDNLKSMIDKGGMPIDI